MTRFKIIYSILTLCFVLTEANTTPSKVEQATILDMHHRAREMVHPPASRMNMMKYSQHLQFVAKRHVHECRTTALYGPLQFRQMESINVALISGSKPTFADVIGGWIDQRRQYDYLHRNRSGFCWNYLHMIHDETTKVGCAIKLCDGLRKHWNSPQYLVACAYDSKHSAELMRSPYKYGKSCQQCQPNVECYRNQCVFQATCESVLPLIAAKGRCSNLKYLPKFKYNVIVSGGK